MENPSLVGLGIFKTHAKDSLTNLVQNVMVLTPKQLLSSSNSLTHVIGQLLIQFFSLATWQREGTLYVCGEIRIYLKRVNHFLLNLRLVLAEGFLNAQTIILRVRPMILSCQVIQMWNRKGHQYKYSLAFCFLFLFFPLYCNRINLDTFYYFLILLITLFVPSFY